MTDTPGAAPSARDRGWLLLLMLAAGAGALVLAFVAGMRVSAPADEAGWTMAAGLGAGLCAGVALLAVCLMRRQSREARKRVEDALRSSVRHLQLVLDAVPDRIWVKDGDGRYVQANRAEALAQGMTVAALLGKTNYDLQPMETAQSVEREDAAVIASGQPLRIERRSNLGGVWIEVIKVPFVLGDGGAKGLMGVARDISVRKEAEASRAMLSALEDHRAVAIFERSLDGTILSWNAGAQAMLGYSVTEAIGQKVHFSMPPGEPTSIEENSARLVRGESFTTASRRLTRDGRILHVIGSHAPVRDAAGTVVGGSILLQDVTALREAEIRASEQEGRYRALFEYSPVPVLVWEHGTQRIVDANEAALATWGYARDELLGMRIPDLHDPEHAAEYTAFEDSMPREATFRGLPRRHIAKDGRRLHMEVSSAPVNWQGPGDRISVLQDVTDSQRAEDTLREARSFLLQTLDSFPGMLVVMDTGHHALFVNRAVADYFGVDAQTLLARSSGAGSGRDWLREDQLFNCEAVLATGRRADAEIRRGGGKEGVQWFQTLRVPLMQPGGMAGVLSIIIDITAQKEAEQALQASESRLRTIIDNVPMLIAHVDAGSRMTFANECYSTWFHQPLAQSSGRDLRELVGNEYYAGIEADVAAALAGKVVVRERRTRAQHHEQYAQFTYYPDRSPEGAVRGFYVFAYDVTEQRAAREALAAERNLLQSILSTLPDFLYVKDRERRYVMMNRSPWSNLVAQAPRDVASLIGRRSSEIFYAADYERIDKEDTAVLMRGESMLNREAFRDDADGRKWWIASKVPLRDAQGRIIGIIGISRDVTALKLASAQIQRLNAELEQRVADRTAQLMAANHELESFAFSVSHDLRAPLRGIDGFSQSLLDEYGAQLPEQARDYLLRVRSASRRMGELIEGMLALSRLAQTELTAMPLDLSAMAEDIAGELKALGLASEGVISIAPGMRARGDPRLLRIVLENLIGNAVKFSGKQAAPRIEVGTMLQNAERVYFVRDNGVGFDMEHADKLFAVFRRLHSEREFPGNGVGLATVQRVVQRHGGRVWANSQRDHGAVFYFTLGPSGTSGVDAVPAAAAR